MSGSLQQWRVYFFSEFAFRVSYVVGCMSVTNCDAVSRLNYLQISADRWYCVARSLPNAVAGFRRSDTTPRTTSVLPQTLPAVHFFGSMPALWYIAVPSASLVLSSRCFILRRK